MKKQIKLPGSNYPILRDIVVLFIIAFALSNTLFAQGNCVSSKIDKSKLEIPEKITEYATSGNLEELKSLIEQDEKLVNRILENGETALTLASYHGHINIVKYLLNKGADTEIINKWNNNALLNTAMKGWVKIGSLLIDNGANINVQGENKNTIVHFAVRNNHYEYVKMALKKGTGVSVMNEFKQTPILYASWTANPEMIKILVEGGADINFVSPFGNSILHNLCSNGNVEAVKFAVSKGAKVNKLNADKQLPLHGAVKYKHAEVVNYLVGITRNLNVKEKHFGNTALHVAAINGDILSTKILLDAGAKGKTKNNQGLTSVDYAAKYGYVDLCKYYMVKKLADEKTLKMAIKSNLLGKNDVNSDEVRFWHTGHSGWVMQFNDKVLVIDYWNRDNKINEGSIANGIFNPDEFKGKKIYVFSTHAHTDHYDTKIFEWQKQTKNINYIYGFKAEDSWVHKEKGYNGPKYTYIDDNKTETIDDIKITTIKSNDTGQGFLMEINGLKIFHPGDHALFNADLKDDYAKEIDFLAKQTNEVDVALLPTTGCPARWQKESIVNGFFYVIDKLNPQVVFPMHAIDREHLLREFADIAKKKKENIKVICVENCGDNYLYSKSLETAKK